MPFKVLTRILDGWEDHWMMDDRPMRFTTVENAEAEITEFLEDVRDAVKRGDMESEYSRDDYKIVEVAEGE